MISALRRLRVLVVPTAWLCALAGVAAVGATLFWRFAAPGPIALPVRLETDPRVAAQRIAGQRPFAGEAPPAAATASGPSHAQLVLVGLATGFIGGEGFALLKSGNDKPAAFVVGEEVASGVRLKRILADAVELERSGRVERLALTEPAGGPAAAGGVRAPDQPLPPGAAPPRAQ